MRTWPRVCGGVGSAVRSPRRANPVTPFFDTPVQAQHNDEIVYVGQLLDFKGVFDLAAAARQAGTRLTVVGDGADRAVMQRRLPKAEYAGWLQGDALRARLAGARAVVVPTRGIEPFGLVAAEAVASGLPVIVSDGLFLAREIAEAGMGLSYPAGDVAALAACLRRVAADDTLVAELSAAAARHGATLAPTEADWIAQIRAVYDRRLAEAGVSGVRRCRCLPKGR